MAEIEKKFVKAFHANMKLLLQQTNTRISQYNDDLTFVGEEGFWDRVGVIDPTEKAGRAADTVITEVPLDRRRAVFADYELATLIDSTDQLRMLGEVTSGYLKAFVAGYQRKKDRVFYDAFFADVGTGKAGTTNVAFPAGQDITTAGGLTVAKLLDGKMLMYENEIDEDAEIHVAISATELGQLLADEKAINKDYGFTALMEANARSLNILGLNFHLYNRIQVDTSGGAQNGRRMIPMWVKEGMGQHLPDDLSIDIGIRRDKSNATQIFSKMSIGATRMQEEQVVRIYGT